MNVAVFLKKEVRESGLLFLYLHGTAGVTLIVVLQPNNIAEIPLKNDFSRILNAVLSIQDAYDQDQGIFSVLEKRRAG